jgi:hypothetical protein
MALAKYMKKGIVLIYLSHLITQHEEGWLVGREAFAKQELQAKGVYEISICLICILYIVTYP